MMLTWRVKKRISSEEGVSLTAKNCRSICSASSDSSAARGGCCGGCPACSVGAWTRDADDVRILSAFVAE